MVTSYRPEVYPVQAVSGASYIRCKLYPVLAISGASYIREQKRTWFRSNQSYKHACCVDLILSTRQLGVRHCDQTVAVSNALLGDGLCMTVAMLVTIVYCFARRSV